MACDHLSPISSKLSPSLLLGGTATGGWNLRRKEVVHNLVFIEIRVMEQVLRIGMTGIVVEQNVKEIGGLAGLFRNVPGVSILSNTMSFGGQCKSCTTRKIAKQNKK
jgi:hypothetical protein